ncbi:unnamed protein product [Bursaphelenchus xylophilus]|uniref:xanthine dehydrogenase n=1 Tax=Bursaphelenchus xylophilus TaxID=6326 RepID=A0A1I7RJ70_BURXY|nr:unnamed protein product [Bursaphelenchus xylophilus]CAG9119418.1 unnamed protein product [Bursaphelenchus xylophilus]
MSYDHEKLIFYVNGKRIEDDNIDPRTTLAVYLRDHLNLTGTKIGCNEGGCGACTVMLSDIDPLSEEIRHYSANACLTPVCMVFGKCVTTVEGIGSVVSKRLHPVQERLAKAHGSQCGFCTPGFVMAMYSLLRNNPKPSHDEIDESLQGNLCRCTGYRPILEAYYSFAEEQNGLVKVNGAQNGTANGCAMGENCCKKRKTNGEAMGSRKEVHQLTDLSKCPPYDPTQEPIFPPELKLHKLHQQSFTLNANGVKWFAPTSFDELLRIKREHPTGRFISGNSELAVELKFRFIDLSVAINPKQVPELRECYLDTERKAIYVGMGLSLTEMKARLNKFIKELPEETTAVLRSVCAMLHYFAGKHVRNMASVAGNIATASPISDLNPIWMAAGAEVLLVSEARGPRICAIDDKFFVGYRRTVIQSDEVLKALYIPLTKPGQFFRAYKQAQRREDDIAIVTGAFLAEIVDNKSITELKMAFGGMAPTTKLAKESVKQVVGRSWNKELLEHVATEIAKEFALPPGVPGGMARYRSTLTISFFFKFFVHVCESLKIPGFTSHGMESRVGEPHLAKYSFTQLYEDVPVDQPDTDPIRRPIMHQSGEKHTTGEAIYAADITPHDALHMAFVTSPVAAGTLGLVDISQAQQEPGFVDFIDWRDVPGNLVFNHWGVKLFAKDEVLYHCQPIGAVLSTDHESARRAAAKVKVDITPQKAVVTIDDAIAAQSFHMEEFKVHSQLAEDNNAPYEPTDWSKYKKIIEGTIRMNGQEHFYLETNNCVVIPGEDDEIEVISSTQCIDEVQGEIAAVLGIPRHKIVVKVKRIGGGFGGKESVCGLFAASACVAAKKHRRPVKLVLERYDDMAISGTRHPFKFDYKIAVDENMKFQDIQVHAYSNSGHAIELSKGVLERCLVHLDNVYKFGNADFYGRMCNTNCASNTAFRGFGGPQGMFGMETIVCHAAEECGFDVDKLRQANMYEEGDCTPFGMHLNQCNIRRCWEECIQHSNYYERKTDVESFNRKYQYRKRGIYLTPTKFGIGFGFKQLNQAGALIHIYKDGSVLVSHGGMEMGQGLHTKILQITASCLGVPIEMVHVNDTCTDKVPNASPTAASVGSDMNGLAVQNACELLNKRLERFKKEKPNGTWKEWVMDAYVNRVCLSQTGFGIIHHETVDFMNGKGAELFGYQVYGVACSEVEVDCLTGDHHLLRTDIVMDIGDSMNPAIDIGQIEGAFVQGYGLFTMEEIKMRPGGTRLTRGPGNYKIPSADDAPRNFNVRLLKGSSNKRAVFSSKAVGEPPLFLGVSALFAIREAVKAYREQNGHKGYFRFDSPATPERIRMACLDVLTEKVLNGIENEKFTPWVVDL